MAVDGRREERTRGPAAGPEDAAESLTFEEALARLEWIVAELERGEVELERALALFEEGVALARRCAARLQEAEQRIQLLIERHGEVFRVGAPELEGEGAP